MERHFTVTGFLVHEARLLLIWHRKIRMWLPPGGHLEDGEEPEEAVIREIDEEAGVRARVVPTSPRLAFDVPGQVPRPEAILIEDIDEPGRPHQHIDLIYFCEALPGGTPGPVDGVAQWVTESDLRTAAPMEYAPGKSEPVPLNVRELGLAALAHFARRAASPGI